MALLGQGATQAPQPVQASVSMLGLGALPMLRIKRIAAGSQASLQLWHQIPCNVRQVSCRCALICQGAWVRSKSASGQAVAHCWQNVHSLLLKSISGKPPSPLMMICVSHASTHAEQRVHISVNSIFCRVQGGRKAEFLRRLNRLRRL